jgi:hypothetical protein
MRCDAMRCDAMRCDAMRCDAIHSIVANRAGAKILIWMRIVFAR